MIRAWKREDGRYTMIFGILSGWLEGRELMRRAGIDPEKAANLVMDAKDIDWATTEKVFGVITGPSSCGCEPAMFRWVGASEVEAGKTAARLCMDCDPSRHVRLGGGYRGPVIYHQCDIIDVCGEPDVAREVFEAEFAAMLR